VRISAHAAASPPQFALIRPLRAILPRFRCANPRAG